MCSFQIDSFDKAYYMHKKLRLLFLHLCMSIASISNLAHGQTNSINQILNLSDSLKYSDPEEAVRNAQKGLALANQSDDKRNVSKSYSMLGVIMCIQGNYTEALNYHLQALKINEDLQDSIAIASNYNNLGMVLDNAGKDSAALTYFLKAIQIQEHKGKKEDLLKTYNNLGILQANLLQTDKAIYYFEKAAQIAHETNQLAIEGSIKHNIAMFHIGEENYHQALDLLSQSLAIHQQTNNDRGAATNYLYIGITCLYLKELKKGLTNLKLAQDLANQKGFNDILSECYLQLSIFYEGEKNFSEALTYLKLWAEVEHAIINEASVSSMAEMQTKYETEKKEKENFELKRITEIQQLTIENDNQKRKNQLILGTALFSLIIVVLLFVYYRKKQTQKTIHAVQLAEADKLRFKAVIEAEEKERARIARELHDGLGQMLSTARLNVSGLNNNSSADDKALVISALKIIDDSCEEVRNIAHNMMPGALIQMGLIPALEDLFDHINASKNLQVHFTAEVTDAIGITKEISIYRIIQEMLNNIIKHAKAKNAHISMLQKGSHLHLQIKDDGLGFDPLKIKDSAGIGWKNIYSRVTMLNGTIEIDTAEGKGLVVNMLISMHP